MQLKRLIKDPLHWNSLLLMVNAGVTAGLGFFFWMIVARFYPDEQVGLGAAIISAASILGLMSRAGLGFALVRFLPQAGKPGDMVNTCLTLGGMAAIALAAIFVAGLSLWSPTLSFVKSNPLFFLSFTSFVFCFTLSSLVEFIFIAWRRVEFVLLKSLTFSVLKIGLAVLLVLFFRTFAIVSSWGLAMAIALLLSLFLFMPRIQKGYEPMPKLDLGIVKSIWRYSLGNSLAELFIVAPGLVLPLFVVNLLGPEQNAYFYIVWTIAGVLFIIPMAASTSLFAEGSHLEEKLQVNVRRSVIFIFALLIPAVMVVFLAGKWILHFGFGADYAENALMLLWLLSLSSIPWSINLVYGTILRVERRTSEIVIIRGFIAIAVLLGSYFIIPATGIVGIGYVWIATQGIVSLYVLLAVRGRYRLMQAQYNRLGG